MALEAARARRETPMAAMMHANVTAPVPWLDGRERGACQHTKRWKVGREVEQKWKEKKERKKDRNQRRKEQVTIKIGEQDLPTTSAPVPTQSLKGEPHDRKSEGCFISSENKLRLELTNVTDERDLPIRLARFNVPRLAAGRK